LLDAQWQSSDLNRKASTQLMPRAKSVFRFTCKFTGIFKRLHGADNPLQLTDNKYWQHFMECSTGESTSGEESYLTTLLSVGFWYLGFFRNFHLRMRGSFTEQFVVAFDKDHIANIGSCYFY